MKYVRTVVVVALAIFLLASLLLVGGCVSGRQEQNAGGGDSGNQRKQSGPTRIGFSMDTLKEERWQRDQDLFRKRAEELGAEVLVQVANGNDRVQAQQCENLLTQKVDVLVIVPHNGEVAASIVESAKRQNVPVISYDRLIKSSDLDLYVSHQVTKIGEMQAQYMLDKAPKGNYVLIGGSPTDNNALLLIEGQKRVLNPAIARGDIRIVAEQMAREWQPSEALKHMENALTANKDIVAVVASNDGTAGGVVEALQAQNLAGKVYVSGQDADLAALQRIVEGKQSMTIYKPIEPLAYSAAEAAIKLARGEKIETTATINNGRKDVPAILHEPIPVDKANISATVIKDGFQKMEAVYKNLPRDQWPN